MTGSPVTLVALPPGHSGLVSARSEPDLAGWGFREVEYVAAGRATSYVAEEGPDNGGWPTDGRFVLSRHEEADFATRVVVRHPVGSRRFSGTLVAEWLNVSAGNDAAPEWTFLGEEVLRAGHAWAGISAQHVGVEGGPEAVHVAERPRSGLRQRSRYAGLSHPGDAFAYEVFGRVAAAVGERLGADVRLGVGESQSAVCLTTYVNGVHPVAPVLDGFLLHSRGAVAPPLDAVRGLVMDDVLGGPPVRIRDDLSVPTMMVQTEGDLFDRIGYLPARQPDTATVRLWEVAGAAHGDRYLMGDFESVLGCAVPVNDGQQVFVLRAALRHLDRWARGGPASAPPVAPRLSVVDGRFELDAVGNVVGGVRTPCVDAPLQLLSGRPYAGASTACRLFGSTLPLPSGTTPPYPDRSAYLAAYTAALDAAVAAGFVLPEDRAAVLADARWPG